MSDQCKSCVVRGYYDQCLETPCFHHENWINLERIKRIKNLEGIVIKAKSAIIENLQKYNHKNEVVLLEVYEMIEKLGI